MFCPLEKLELKVNTCPTRWCIYKGVGGTCNFTRLTREGVTVRDIAEVRQKLPYKIQTMAATAKQAVTTGATLWTYAEYIKASFPSLRSCDQTVQTVNKHDDTHVSKVLFLVFGLSSNQQRYFWDETRLTEWARLKGLSLTLPEVRTVLLAASMS